MFAALEQKPVTNLYRSFGDHIRLKKHRLIIKLRLAGNRVELVNLFACCMTLPASKNQEALVRHLINEVARLMRIVVAVNFLPLHCIKI